jgi:hypothetical protein
MPPPSPIRSVTQVMSMPCSVLLLDAILNGSFAIILILILLHPVLSKQHHLPESIPDAISIIQFAAVSSNQTQKGRDGGRAP